MQNMGAIRIALTPFFYLVLKGINFKVKNRLQIVVKGFILQLQIVKKKSLENPRV